jgi:hypothetical protein
MAKFTFTREPVVDWPVTVQVPTQRGVEAQTFTARFRILPMADRQEIGDIKALMARAWVGWGADLLDADGAPLAFSDGVRDELMGYDYIVTAVSRAYARACMGVEEKN